MALRLSASLSELDKLACGFPVSDTTSANYADDLPSSVATLHSQLALARQQILILKSENAFFREEVDSLRRSSSSLIAEISVLQVTLEYVKQSKAPRLPVSDKEKILQLEKRLADYQKLIRALAEGLNLDPDILGPTHSHIYQDPESALVEAIRDAARNKDSPWSKILPTLIKSTQEKHIAAVNLILNTRNDLYNMEKLAHFWKARATLSPLYRPNVFHRHTAVISSRHESGNDLADASSAVSFPVRPPLLVPVSSDHLRENMPRGIKSSSRPLRYSHSDEINSSTNQSIRGVRNKYVRRTASDHFKILDIQAPEKRHGFIMPCIKMDLNRDSSPSAHAHSDLNGSPNMGICSIGPFPKTPLYGPNAAPGRVSLRTARIFQSAERLCATFSSGSLGSLEASTLSEQSTDVIQDPFPDDSQSFQDLLVAGVTTSMKPRDLAHPSYNHNSSSGLSNLIKGTSDDAGRANNFEFTTLGDKTAVKRQSTSFNTPSPTTIKLPEKPKVPPPLTRTTTKVLRPLTDRPTTRTVRLCRSGMPACLPNQSRATPPSLRVQISPSRSPSRNPRQTSGSGFTLKSALAKPITMTSATPQGIPQFASNNEVGKQPTLNSKLRNGLRVVNSSAQGELSSNQTQSPKSSRRQRHGGTIPDKNLPSLTGIGNQRSQFVSRGRGNHIGSMSGTTGGTGRDLSHMPSPRAKTMDVERRKTTRP